jgi:hypothetical protein
MRESCQMWFLFRESGHGLLGSVLKEPSFGCGVQAVLSLMP